MPLISELPFGEQPINKMREAGVQALSNTELLATVCGTDDLNSALEAITKAGGITVFADMTPQGMASCGLTDEQADRLAAAVEFGFRLERQKTTRYKISSPEEVAQYFTRSRFEKVESFHVLSLDVKGGLIRSDKIGVGGRDSVTAEAHEVFRKAVECAAAAIICVHNHPSGFVDESLADIDVTRRIVKAGEILGIKVVDHVIVGERGFCSLKSRGLIPDGGERLTAGEVQKDVARSVGEHGFRDRAETAGFRTMDEYKQMVHGKNEQRDKDVAADAHLRGSDRTAGAGKER